MFTPNTYATAIERALSAAGFATATRRRILDEQLELLRELADSGRDLGDELGSPEEYAHSLVEGLDGDPGIEATAARLIDQHAGVFTRQGRSRIWNPQDPSILQPHLLGLGWSINWGAVAVRLGWIRPDDIDADVIESIPSPALRTAQAVPAALAAAHLFTLAASWKSLPDTVHTGWSATGKPKKAARSRGYLAVPALLGAATAAAALIPAARGDREDSLNAASMATLICALTPASFLGNLAERKGLNPGVPGALGAVAGIAASVAVVALPLRSGLKSVWKKEGVV